MSDLLDEKLPPSPFPVSIKLVIYLFKVFYINHICYRNHSTNLQCKPMTCALYDGDKLVQKKHLITFNKFLAKVTILQLLKESINWKWDVLYSEYNRENIGQEWVK